jgi:hypothetical protein
MIKYHGEKYQPLQQYLQLCRYCNDFYTFFCKGDALEVVSKNQGQRLPKEKSRADIKGYRNETFK